MEVCIDRENCGNCLLCVDTSPEVFELRESEVEVICENVPPAFQADCRYASEIGPTQAIEIKETPSVV